MDTDSLLPDFDEMFEVRKLIPAPEPLFVGGGQAVVVVCQEVLQPFLAALEDRLRGRPYVHVPGLLAAAVRRRGGAGVVMDKRSRRASMQRRATAPVPRSLSASATAPTRPPAVPC